MQSPPSPAGRAPLLLAVTVAASLACGGASEPDLVPGGGHVDPASVGVDPFAGRWRSVRPGDPDDPAAGFVPACDDPRFVEIRSDGIGGWELVAGGDGSLRVIELLSAEATAQGATFQVREPTLDADAAAGVATETLTWVEPGPAAPMSVAQLSVHPGVWLVSPSAAASLPACP